MDGRENQPLLAEPVAAAMPMAMAVPVAAAPMAHDGGGGESKYGAAPIAVAVPVSQQGGKSVFDAMPSAPPMQGISDQYSAHDQVRTPLLQGPPPLCLSVSSHDQPDCAVSFVSNQPDLHPVRFPSCSTLAPSVLRPWKGTSKARRLSPVASTAPPPRLPWTPTSSPPVSWTPSVHRARCPWTTFGYTEATVSCLWRRQSPSASVEAGVVVAPCRSRRRWS